MLSCSVSIEIRGNSNSDLLKTSSSASGSSSLNSKDWDGSSSVFYVKGIFGIVLRLGSGIYDCRGILTIWARGFLLLIKIFFTF
jgi:hypothetical protein